MAIQQEKIVLAPAWVNANQAMSLDGQALRNKFTLFKDYPQQFDVWNIEYRAVQDTLGDVKTALSGYEIAPLSGYRVLVNITLERTTPAQTASLRTLLNKLSSQFLREPGYNFDLDEFNYGAASARIKPDGVVLVPPKPYPYVVSGALTNAVVSNTTLGEYRTVIAHTASSDRIQFGAPIPGWLDTHKYRMFLTPRQQPILAVGFNTSFNVGNQPEDKESWATGLLFCRVTDSDLSLNRQMTIGTQAFSLNLRSVERFRDIPEQLVL